MRAEKPSWERPGRVYGFREFFYKWPVSSPVLPATMQYPSDFITGSLCAEGSYLLYLSIQPLSATQPPSLELHRGSKAITKMIEKLYSFKAYVSHKIQDADSRSSRQFEFWEKYGCSNALYILSLSMGFLFKHSLIKFLASAVTFLLTGNYTSGNYFIIPVYQI